MKYLLIATRSKEIMNFRKTFIEYLIEKGHSVSVIAFDGERKEDIEKLNAKVFVIEQDNRGLNPFSILSFKKQVKKIVKAEKPDVVLTYQLKPNTLAVNVSKKAGAKKVYSMVEGLGDVYIKNGLKWKLIRAVVNFLYKQSFKKAEKVFFLNNDDKQEFIQRKLIKAVKCIVINGIGVDLKHFEQKPLKNYNTVLMVARMLKSKGVLEYLECARQVKKVIPSATFNYLGGEGDITKEDIKEYIDDGSINYLGVVKDVRPYLEDCSVFVLPTYYREGLPMSIMEAESVSRAIITTNSVGAKETVKNGYNGFLIQTKNVNQLTEKVLYLLENKDKLKEMGQNSRTFAEQNFDKEIINNEIYQIVSE